MIKKISLPVSLLALSSYFQNCKTRNFQNDRNSSSKKSEFKSVTYGKELGSLKLSAKGSLLKITSTESQKTVEVEFSKLFQKLEEMVSTTSIDKKLSQIATDLSGNAVSSLQDELVKKLVIEDLKKQETSLKELRERTLGIQAKVKALLLISGLESEVEVERKKLLLENDSISLFAFDFLESLFSAQVAQQIQSYNEPENGAENNRSNSSVKESTNSKLMKDDEFYLLGLPVGLLGSEDLKQSLAGFSLKFPKPVLASTTPGSTNYIEKFGLARDGIYQEGRPTLLKDIKPSKLVCRFSFARFRKTDSDEFISKNSHQETMNLKEVVFTEKVNVDLYGTQLVSAGKNSCDAYLQRAVWYQPNPFKELKEPPKTDTGAYTCVQLQCGYLKSQLKSNILFGGEKGLVLKIGNINTAGILNEDFFTDRELQKSAEIFKAINPQEISFGSIVQTLGLVPRDEQYLQSSYEFTSASNTPNPTEAWLK